MLSLVGRDRVEPSGGGLKVDALNLFSVYVSHEFNLLKVITRGKLLALNMRNLN